MAKQNLEVTPACAVGSARLAPDDGNEHGRQLRPGTATSMSMRSRAARGTRTVTPRRVKLTPAAGTCPPRHCPRGS